LRICRFDEDRLGVVLDDAVADVSEVLETLPSSRWVHAQGDAVIANWSTLGPAIERLMPRAKRKALCDIRLKSPVATPSKIIGIARNRRNLEAETLDVPLQGQTRHDGDPIHMFIKAASALAGQSDGVELRFPDRRTDPEAELTIVIGRTGADISLDDALSYVFGYTIGLDMTLRGNESPSSRKSLDTYALVGPWIATQDEIPDPDKVTSMLSINGRIVQQASTADFAFDVRSIIAHASSYYTLYPGDLIMAGTPAQFEQVRPGDIIVTTFAGLGTMEVAIRSHSARR
jgi:2-keto-4-pentenoate hydratase/2-oxohepta-3-ene-1,7-dioic acid hydratase in catechol pathway